MQRLTDSVSGFLRASQPRNLPLRIIEMNSINLGGKGGVSDVFASALWGSDVLFTLAEQGVAGVNLHTYRWRCGGGYNPICANGNKYSAEPLYYGMLLFSYAGKGRIAPIEVSTPLNLTTHATIGDDGKLRVTFVNKDAKQTIAVQVKTGKPYSKASILRLLAPSLESRTGITFGGRAVNDDGSWSPGTAEPVIQNGDVFQIAVPAASAVVITFE